LFVSLVIQLNAESLKQGDNISFVACPIVRDTKTVPCWYSEYQGVNYYLGIQQDIGANWYPPQLKHKILVEGKITGESVCGGIKLNPMHTSVLPELSLECDTLLPAEDNIIAPHGERGAGPNTEKPGSGGPRPRSEGPKPPFKQQDFIVHYDFDGIQIYNREFVVFRQAVNYAKVSKAKSLTATVYRGSALLSDGSMIVESESVIADRTRGIERWLAYAELPAEVKTEVVTASKAAKPNGKDDYNNRRVVITVTP